MIKKTKKARAAEQPSRPVLATLTPEELDEWRRRRVAFDQAHLQALAAGAYLDQHVAELRSRHELPRFWDLDITTGVIRGVPDPDEAQA